MAHTKSPINLELRNDFLTLGFKIGDEKVNLDYLINHLAGDTLDLSSSTGFVLHQGDACSDAPRTHLCLQDFTLKGCHWDDLHLRLHLENSKQAVTCEWEFALLSDQPYLRCWLEVTNLGKEILCLADVDVLSMSCDNNLKIPVKRSVDYGYGEGVVLVAEQSVFSSLEALLFDHRLGIDESGKGFCVGHNPGWQLTTGGTARSKKAVLGVAPKGEAGRWFVEKYLTPNWRQIKQGDRKWDRYWAYNITSDDEWSLGTRDMETLAKALKKAREVYGFGFNYVGSDITSFVEYDPFEMGLNPKVFPDGYDATAKAIESTGARVEGYYGIGTVEDVKTPEARQHYRDLLFELVERYRIKMLIFDGYVGGRGGDNIYWREKVWDNFCETIEALQEKYPDLYVGLESFSPNLVSRWLWANSQFDHHASHYLKYNPDAHLNNVHCELIPDAGAGAAPVLHGRDVNTASAGVYELFGVPWRGVETFGPLWQLIYNPFYQGSAAMERSRDNWVLNLFGAATILSPVIYGRIFGQPPEDLEWLGRILKLRDENWEVFSECIPNENGDIFHGKMDRCFAVFRNLRWEANAIKSFILDDKIGLTNLESKYLVRQLYPTERVLTKPDGNWQWKFGERVKIQMNPFELQLLFVEPIESLVGGDSSRRPTSETLVIGCDIERNGQGQITLLGLPGENYQIRTILPRAIDGKVSSITFNGPKNTDNWYRRLTDLTPMTDSEKSTRQRELLHRIDFVKATGYPATWRASNLYGLLDYHRQHPYPYQEIEDAREIRLDPVYESMKWFCDDDLNTPPKVDTVSITHAPIFLGHGAVQADLGEVCRVRRILIAAREPLTELAVRLSRDGHEWTMVSLSPDGAYWHSGDLDLGVRYICIASDQINIQEFQVFVKESSGEQRRLDWSTMHPYPISIIRALTRPSSLSFVWSAKLSLPPQTYDGQQIAIPIWMKEGANLPQLWPLYSVDGQQHSAYQIVPSYAKEGVDPMDAGSQVKGLTFKLPIFAQDAGKEMEIIIASEKELERADVWLVSDPLPYCRIK